MTFRIVWGRTPGISGARYERPPACRCSASFHTTANTKLIRAMMAKARRAGGNRRDFVLSPQSASRAMPSFRLTRMPQSYSGSAMTQTTVQKQPMHTKNHHGNPALLIPIIGTAHVPPSKGMIIHQTFIVLSSMQNAPAQQRRLSGVWLQPDVSCDFLI